MKNFLQIASGVDVVPLMIALQTKPHLWDQFPIRTQHPGTAHSEVSDVLLMFNEIPEEGQERVIDDREVVPFPAWHELPEAQKLVFDLMRRVSGVRLGRVIITKLPPGKSITPHVDGGAPATFFTRFQVALQSLPGCIFTIDDEQVQFQSGDAWLIDNTKIHGVRNNSADERIVMIVDIKTV